MLEKFPVIQVQQAELAVVCIAKTVQKIVIVPEMAVNTIALTALCVQRAPSIQSMTTNFAQLEISVPTVKHSFALMEPFSPVVVRASVYLVQTVSTVNQIKSHLTVHRVRFVSKEKPLIAQKDTTEKVLVDSQTIPTAYFALTGFTVM